ncbi:hypothetical protein [Hymenobacter rubidus]|uniref:hypothetical protein n=1 Tax=Hymenobacter rubidus TaxID=1441626 RepID=UPI00191CEB2F|nr:hypothetical protein [Hymenobacter rubidus]
MPPEINGENLVPNGGLTGAAYVLGTRGPDALTLLASGQRTREHAAQQQATARQKQAEQIGKAHQEDLKYKTETGRLFQPSFDEHTAGAYDVLTGIERQRMAGKIDGMEASRQAAQYKREIEALRIHGTEKQRYWDERTAQVAHDPTRNLTNYTTALGHSLISPDGKRVLATAHDPEATAAALDNDPTTYNEPAVVAKVLHDVVPTITQKVAEAGTVGGQHYADQVRGQLLYMEHGKPVFNADGTPRLNLDGGGAALLDQGPVKVLADAREAAYNKQREEREAARLTDPGLPSLPKISRNGHLSMMFGPAIAYSQSHEEANNPRPPQPRAAAKPNPNEVTVTPAVGFQLSHYEQPGQQPGAVARTFGAKPGPATLVANHYPVVGQSFGSQKTPFVPVTVDNARAEIVGQDGKPTHLPKAAPNGKIQMQLTSRDYALYVNGKRLGRSTPYTTPAEAYQDLLSTIASLTPEQARKAELRTEYRGAVVDKEKTAYDGVGGKLQAIGTNNNGGPTYDSGTSEKRYNVILPADQYTDGQLQRATGGKWNPRIPTKEQRAVIDALRAKGGRLVTPYSQAPAALPTPKEKADPLGFGDSKPTGVDWGRGGKVYQ